MDHTIAMAITADRKAHQDQDEPLRKQFWERWSTRVGVIIVAVGAVVGLAVVGDPGHESWQTKTWEMVHDLVVRGHPGAVRLQ
jgi:hypothetical protein